MLGSLPYWPKVHLLGLLCALFVILVIVVDDALFHELLQGFQDIVPAIPFACFVVDVHALHYLERFWNVLC